MAVLHVGLRDFDAMEIDELIALHDDAVAFVRAMHGVEDD